jgi:hypothetical protein
VLVTDLRIVDQTLFVGNDGAGIAQHFRQTLRDRHVVLGRSRACHRTGREHQAKREDSPPDQRE